MLRDLLVAAALCLGSAGALAEEPGPTLEAGATELGLGGSLVRGGGARQVTLLVRAGTFRAAGGALLGGEIEAGYGQRSSLDELSLEGSLSMQFPAGSGAVWPFAALAGGWSQEWVGSFSQARYPLGLNLGFRALFSRGAAVRGEYRFRRVLGDPVSSFYRHEVVLGLSILLGNSPRSRP